jgi:hypothetical protein
MSDKNFRHNMKELLIEVYEEVLTDKRRHEADVLNAVRDREYQKNRPPAPHWWSLKDSSFNQECYRNRVALKPDGENDTYLAKL